MLRLGCASRESAANLLGITRTCQGSLPPEGILKISGGVLSSFPGQNGHVGTKAAVFRSGRREAISSGRLARSVAMMTHSLVAKFWRSSGISKLLLVDLALCY